MKKTLFIIFIGAALLCSCEKRFELHPENYSNMIRLQCVADADKDSVYIFPSLCVPTQIKLSDRSKTPPGLEITGMGIEIDGEYRQAILTEYKETETVYDDFDYEEYIQRTHEEVVTKYRWAVPGSVPEGASLKIKATAEGTGPVYGETVMPVKPQVNLKVSPFEYTEGIGDNAWTTDYLKIRVDITDKANNTGYYAMQILQETSHVVQYTDEAKAKGFEDQVSTAVQGIYPEKLNETAFDDLESDSRISIGYDGYRLSYSYLGPLLIYRSEELDGQEFSIRAFPDHISTGNPFFIKEETRSKYRIKVYRLSPEIYRYAKAYNLEGNELSEAGLAPVNFTYSNIVGGSGYFGAFTHYESEWFDNPFIQEYQY